ncbi:Fasciclin domain-containing protein [Podospora australis]|uniref:Fasciclin domain-containing protein n=1 Tax=Podospora australis TaxID=1536484 RepID=A0AAN6WRZ8_9PEZI|nr:Fasciclin domain-containing protein [Podospora australis]
MKHLTLLFAATAAALVVHPEGNPQQTSLVEDKPQVAVQDAVQTWWNSLPNPESLFTAIESRIKTSLQHVGDVTKGLDFDPDSDSDDDGHPHPHPPHHPPRRGGRHHGDKTKTIYELIKDNKYTTKFAKLVEENDEIKSLLDDTEHNHTLFVPTDKAFEGIPHKPKEPPSKEFILSLLKYHALPGLYTARHVLHSHTLPTELSPDSLGDHPQRLRVSLGFLFSIRLNLYSKIVLSNIEAKNGVIHAVDGILVPPPSQAKIISLLPGSFSTFSLGLEKTGLADDLSKSDEAGGTLFAPTNRAFQKLGPGANAFLFSERGKKYLKAILKYHVVLGETLYSDAFYNKKKDDGDEETNGYWHVDLPTQLDDKPLAVDVKSWKGFVEIVLNGFTKVAFKDGVASDGVVHVINSVLIPPHKHHGEADETEREYSVEELKERLGPYVGGGEVRDL